MEIIKTGTNIATVKISDLPKSTDTAGRSTLATNADNESEALGLTQIAEAINAAAIAQQAATDAQQAAKNANTLAGVARTAASNAEAAAEDAQTARDSAETAANTAQQAAADAEETAADISQDLTGKADLDADKKYLLPTQLDPTTGYQTAVTVGGSKGYFKSETPALVTPDQPSTLIVCFKVPQSGTTIIYDCNTTDSVTTAKGEYIYVQATRNVRVNTRSSNASFLKTLPENTQLCMAAISYTPNGALIKRINEFVDETESPEYSNAYEPEHMRLGGWSSSYEKTQIISVRRFDFAMTKEQLEEAWNGGHPELWKVPDKYRYGEVGARCFLDLNPKGLLPTVWRDMSGHGNDVPYYPMITTSSPTECELSYENHGFKDKIFGTAAPTIAPNFTGQEFVDTTNKVTYTAYGTNAASDWGLN